MQPRAQTQKTDTDVPAVRGGLAQLPKGTASASQTALDGPRRQPREL